MTGQLVLTWFGEGGMPENLEAGQMLKVCVLKEQTERECLCICVSEYVCRFVVEEYRLIVSMKQFDSIFHSIKLAIRTGAVWLSALTHFQIPLLIERVYVLVSGKLEKFITWKMLYFSPSRLCTACPPSTPLSFLTSSQ